jgi:hypothetical protein
MAQQVQIGKYRRPGIFIEEFDESVITSPSVDGITNTIIGVSKKGPVNTPILLRNIGDLERVFGQLDRSLERKGSFFHRTISKMLEASPVFAINLLLTDDNLDKLEYRALSTATTIQNDIKREGPYRRFFDTTSFWRRDTDSFLNLATNNSVLSDDKLLKFTNMSDRPVSLFIFKSKRNGFDRSLLEWYGSVEKMPPYVNQTDLASDYLVDVLVVSGDWSDYRSLSIDPRFTNYFSPQGLRKDQVRNFSNDRNVTTLAFAEGLSLIPYFRDLNGQNIFIETVINRGTDQHGVFCAFNNEVFETDYPNGLIDLLGNNLAGDTLTVFDEKDGLVDGEVNINFLSYQDKITENNFFTQTVLDRPGNVFALFGTASLPGSLGNHGMKTDNSITYIGGVLEGYVQNSNRTAWFHEGYVNDLIVSDATGFTSSISITYEVDTNGYAVIGGQYVKIEDDSTLDIVPTFYNNTTSTTQSYVATYVLDTTGTIKVLQTNQQSTNPTPQASDIVLGYVEFDVVSNEFVNVDFVDVTVGSGGYIPLEYGVDFEYTIVSNKVTVEFLGTNVSPNPRFYDVYRRFKAFNSMLTYLQNNTRGCLLSDAEVDQLKVESSLFTISNIRDVNTRNRSFDITLNSNDFTISSIFDENGSLVIYRIDDELILGRNGIDTKIDKADITDIGVVAKYSSFYSRYEDGFIRTTDIIYQKGNYSPVQVNFLSGGDVDDSLGGYNYIVFGVNQNEVDYLGSPLTDIISKNENYFGSVLTTYQFLLSGNRNSGAFTVVSDAGLDPLQNELLSPTFSYTNTPEGRADALDLLSGGELGFDGNSNFTYFAFEIDKNVTTEVLNNVQNVLAYNPSFNDAPIYLDMYQDENLNLVVRFEDSELQSPQPFDSIDLSGEQLWANMTFVAKSFMSNYKQTIEIEFPVGYVTSPNKILVRADRYTEVKVGDFLEAAFNPDDLEVGQMPKKLTRIVTKRLWSGDSAYVELSCDAEIKISYFGTGVPGDNDQQTFRYIPIDNYVDTYKAISLKGFRIRQESLPDGTEAKQNTILNLVAKGTPLFKAVTNKEAFDFRYLIDSFGLGLTERSKQQLLDICGERLDCFGILNMPSLRQFKNSSSPTFVDSEGVLQTEFIAQGGDLESNPAFLYSFGDGRGVSSVGYFTPWLNVNDNGRPVDVPPAAYVGLTFMRKHNSTVTNIVPWTIAAGITNGRITNINGLEMDFTPEDIENLNQAGMNPIVFKRNRGFMIETENTAQTLFNSALSLIHVREVLIELERELSAMLLDFQWKFNTPEVRAEIKLRADVICETYVSRNGLFNYFNKCDEENNTSEIIDNQIGVLDTYVEPVKGMGIIVNNITILRTGAINAGGFIQS